MCFYVCYYWCRLSSLLFMMAYYYTTQNTKHARWYSTKSVQD
jgi:cob(I)alamin adenosyltransferase